jgi:hypothetical protein
MAKVIEISGQYILELSTWEKIGSLHSNPNSSTASLISITTVENPWSKLVLRGVRAPGTGIPYVILLGTMRFRGGKDFTAIYGKAPVEIYEFDGGEFKRWIISKR